MLRVDDIGGLFGGLIFTWFGGPNWKVEGIFPSFQLVDERESRDVLLAALHVPLTLTGAGAVSAADRKRLTESGAIGAPEDLDDLIAAGLAAGLLTPIGRELVVTAAGEQWLDGGTVARRA